MADSLKVGLLAAIGAGTLFGIITAIEGAVGRVVGGLNSSLFEHFFAGIIAIVILLLILIAGKGDLGAALPVLPICALGAILVLAAVAAIAFAIPRTGVAAGNFALVFAQLLIAILIDSAGLGGMQRIPLTPGRVLGFLVMAFGIYLVLPKEG